MSAFPTQEHIEAAQKSGDYWFEKKNVYSFPSFRLAQTAIESANGKALSGDFNYWGVKATKGQIASGKFKSCLTHEVIHGQTVSMYADFASYDSLTDGYIQQAELLVTSKYYEASRHDTNPKQYAIDVAVHYATAPNYAQVIIDYMTRNNLFQYDHPSQAPVYPHSTKLQPPITEQRKAQVPVVVGAVVVAGTAATTVVHHHFEPGLIIAGVLTALICGALAILKHKQAEATLKKILTPLPIPAEPATPATSPIAPAVTPAVPVTHS